MARGRFISRSIDDNLQLARCSERADHLFRRMITHLDVEGRMVGEPRLVKAICCKLRDEFTWEIIRDCLHELANARDHEGKPLLVWYEAGGKSWLWFPGFDGHQQGLRKDREAPTVIPPPPDMPWLHGPAPEDLFAAAGVPGPLPEQLRSNSGVTLPIRDKVEVEVDHTHTGNGQPSLGENGKPARPEYPEEFEALCGMYPQRAGGNPKREAYQSYTALLKKGVKYEALRDAVLRYKAYCQVTSKEGTEYVMQMASFFGPKRQGWREAWTPPIVAAPRQRKPPVPNYGGDVSTQRTASRAWVSSEETPHA